MALIVKFLMGMLKKVLTFAIVFAVIVFIWNIYKAKRESRTFISQFNNVEGLAKGAPIFSNGIEVGKVIKIFPIGNSNNVAVKGLITEDKYPSPKGSVHSRIITNFKGGGGKAVELLGNSFDESQLERIGLKEEDFMHEKKLKKALNTPSMKVVLRILRDTFQMSKDFALSLMAAFSSEESKTYQNNLKNSINNTITSIEYGTVRQDVKHGIERINDEIQNFEKKPNKEAIVERNLKSQAMALRNTLDSYANLSNVYKD